MSTVEWLIAICLISLLIALGASLYEKAPAAPVQTIKLKAVSLTCIEVKSRVCMKYELRED